MEKNELRKHIKAQKKLQDPEKLSKQSATIMDLLEQNIHFINAKTVMLYFSLPDEVQTADFIEKWKSSKRIILPTVVGDDIIPVEVTQDTSYKVGDFNILEPQNKSYTGDYDLIVVPGVAFDKNGNRLGRGKGYYDRFLSKIGSVHKIGICYDFQFVDNIPTEANDIPVDEVISLGELG